MSNLLSPISPGDILKEEFMDPYGITSSRLAKDIDVPANRISEIVAGRRTITADTAIRLGVYFNIHPQFWLNLQTEYDLRTAVRTTAANIFDKVRPFIHEERLSP